MNYCSTPKGRDIIGFNKVNRILKLNEFLV